VEEEHEEGPQIKDKKTEQSHQFKIQQELSNG
jgi:hypothetical protein